MNTLNSPDPELNPDPWAFDPETWTHVSGSLYLCTWRAIIFGLSLRQAKVEAQSAMQTLMAYGFRIRKNPDHSCDLLIWWNSEIPPRVLLFYQGLARNRQEVTT